MILSSTESTLDKYTSLSPLLNEAFKFLLSSEFSNFEDGTIKINGDKLYCTVSTQKGKKKEDAKLEFHRNYIDIHFTIEGKDTIGWRATKDCKEIATSYDNEKDYGFYSDTPDCWVTVKPGNFAIFFPEDAHAPLVYEEGIIRKAVIKIAVNP